VRVICFYFFFQAEDGIRDFHVTGVQTCALPIFMCPHRAGNLSGSHEPLSQSQSPSRSLQTHHTLTSIVQKATAIPPCKPSSQQQIGRASCRERVKISLVAA